MKTFLTSYKPKNGELSTYSEQLDPDYTVVLKHKDVIKLIHFDAKYKLKNVGYVVFCLFIL